MANLSDCHGNLPLRLPALQSLGAEEAACSASTGPPQVKHDITMIAEAGSF